MNTVRIFDDDKAAERLARIEKLAVEKSGGPPYDGGMEVRVIKLEVLAEKTTERLNAIEKDLAVIKGSVESFKQEAFRAFATKADVAEAKNSIIMWVVSAILLAQLLPTLLKKFGL